MRKMKKIGILVFCLALGSCTAISFAAPPKQYSQAENRALEAKPEISFADIISGDYQAHYEKYLNDQIFLRDAWVRIAAGMERLLGKKDINGVYLGKDGYLIEKYKDTDFDPAQAQENVRTLAEFLNGAEKKFGKNHVCCIMVPSKGSALPDKMPDYAAAYDVSGTVGMLLGSLDNPDILLDAGKTLQEHQDEYIYYRTDHHWTTLGAYYAYCAFAGQAGHKAKPLEAYDRETVFQDFYGTSYNKVQIPVAADSVELFHSKEQDGVRVIEDGGEAVSDSFYFLDEASKGFNRYNVFFSKNTAQIQVHTKAKTGRALLVIKDSFANCFVPFLAGDYDEILMVDCRYSKGSIQDVLAGHQEITDVLVMYNVEKFMQETNLRALDIQQETMEEFNMDDFFSDMEE